MKHEAISKGNPDLPRPRQSRILPWQPGLVVGVLGNNVPGLLLVLKEDAERRGLEAMTIMGASPGGMIHSTSECVLGLRKLAEALRTVVLVDLRLADKSRVSAMVGSNRHASLMTPLNVLDYVVADYAPIYSDQRDDGRNYMGNARYLVTNDGDIVSLAWFKLPIPVSPEYLSAPMDLKVQGRQLDEYEEAKAADEGPQEGDPL